MSVHYKILVADDAISVCDSVKTILTESSEQKYLVFSALNGREACTMAYHERPDLILMDVEMPVMNGIDAIKKIKGNNLIKHIPIVVMSSKREVHEAFSAGADDFLLKPFSQYELLLRVQLDIKLAAKSSEIKKQHDLLKGQKQEAIDQRDTISKQKADLIDDLYYARFVQNAILPSEEMFNSLFKAHFILNQPKSVVSGDFYWGIRKNEKIIFAVGDCTGHGMSGALMTMAAAAFLNEIVTGLPQLSADQILNDLRKKVIQLLNQKGNMGEASNGMDIVLCMYDEKNSSIEFAGANNPLYIVRKGELEVIKGDRMPIGFYFNDELPFTSTKIQIAKGDTIYLFTDGYADQFGGPREKKFRYSQFQELLTEAADLQSMEEQYELIKNTMDEWIDGYEQVDDMLILGIRF
jgi:serine phosphatase RsbU (regulator of sigma subunit)